MAAVVHRPSSLAEATSAGSSVHISPLRHKPPPPGRSVHGTSFLMARAPAAPAQAPAAAAAQPVRTGYAGTAARLVPPRVTARPYYLVGPAYADANHGMPAVIMPSTPPLSDQASEEGLTGRPLLSPSLPEHVSAQPETAPRQKSNLQAHRSPSQMGSRMGSKELAAQADEAVLKQIDMDLPRTAGGDALVRGRLGRMRKMLLRYASEDSALGYTQDLPERSSLRVRAAEPLTAQQLASCSFHFRSLYRPT
eukprot:TRINITY_DN38477_c0_g1_i2.p1 TRINITY_DN38477_c0_g1~~TRINITY_DN38477_c0_g1_i2.p1  ORF type:complete len:251 (-),score=32.72 TRINITY_DN38477_c0_g1_i2:97-849(-)